MSDTYPANDNEIATVDFNIQGGRLLREYASALVGIERLYEGLLTVDRLMENPEARYWGRLRLDEPVGPLVFPVERLVLVSIEASSPGVLSVLGNFRPLEQIRLYLGDRHERKKDKAYRNREEERRLVLENDLLDLQLQRDRISAWRDLGTSDAQISAMFSRYLLGPIEEIERAQDSIGLGELTASTDG